MTRVIHTGDTHLGYQQYNSPERRRDFRRAFRQVVEDAVAADVDAVVHAGDLFHDRRPGLVDLQATVEILRLLDDAEIPFLAVVGNHEGKRDAQWLDLFGDLGLATRLGRDPVRVGDVAFYGLDFVPRSRRDDLEYAFEPEDADHSALVAHGLFEPFPHADWDTETVLSESTVDFDAMLLGDNHAADTAQVDDTWVTYCGSTERASASERPDRGYNVVAFEDDVRISRRGIEGTRPFVFVDVELGPTEGVETVRERVREHDTEDAVTVVTIDGEGDPITPAEVEEAALDGGALVARVNDHRDVDDDADLSVQFADPDDAVRERLRDLGLSDAARRIDRTVRATDDVADSNVRETVERRVRTLLEDDPDALEPSVDAEEPEAEKAETDSDEDGGTDEDDTDERGDTTGDNGADGLDETAENHGTDDPHVTAGEDDGDEPDDDHGANEEPDDDNGANGEPDDDHGANGEPDDDHGANEEPDDDHGANGEPDDDHGANEEPDDGEQVSMGDFA